MATVNKRVKNTETTHEGAPAALITPLQQLRRSVLSCLLWEDGFYESGQTIAERICELVGKCKVEDVVAVTLEAKRDMRLRHVPLLLARELCRTKEGRKALGQVIPEIITRPDDVTELLAMYLTQKKAPRESAKLPNQLKKHLGRAFHKFDEYKLAKWNGGSKAVSLKDAMKLLHPTAVNEEENALWKRLIDGKLAVPDTWEVAISGTTDKKAEWTRLLTENKLGGLAMLRNIRNMRQNGIDDELIKIGIEGIHAGKLLPINFIAAANHNVQFEPQIEKKFLECFTGREKIAGKTIILIDVSQSMDGKLSGRSELRNIDVACSLGMIGAELFPDLRIFTFSNNVVEVPVRHGFALRDSIMRSQVHNGTYLGQALGHMPECDRLIVITDEQSADRVEQRKGYMINVASNKNGVGYQQWVHIDGWSDKIIEYIIKKENLEIR